MVGVLQIGGLVCLLAAFLFGDQASRASSGFIGATSREINAILSDPFTQWMVLLCLVLYFIAFSIFEWRSLPNGKWGGGNPILWQFAFVALILLDYGFNYSAASKTVMIPIVFGTLVSGKVVALWVDWKRECVERRFAGILALLIFLLAASSIWKPMGQETFQYHQMSRWSGPWDNPNLFGLLMGVTVILSLAMGVRASQVCVGRFRKSIWTFVCLLTFLFCGYFLFKSLSRGAWLGTAAGMVYLFLIYFRTLRFGLAKSSFFLAGKNGLHLGIIIAALFVLSFWQFRFTEWRPAQRAFSVSNINDFSWRNRVVAWEGALRMMADQPWFGCGWSRAEATYGEKYLPPPLGNSAAIQMNDYFMIGISAGVPALVCFLMYVGLSLRSGSKSKAHSSTLLAVENEGAGVSNELAWLQTTGRAGALVLLVGFFFDGGLFKLATGSVFWILLELGREDTNEREVSLSKSKPQVPPGPVRNEQRTEQSEGSLISTGGRPVLLWKWMAGVVGTLAIIETIVLVGLPFLPVNQATLFIARHWLVPPKAVGDLDFLAAEMMAQPALARGHQALPEGSRRRNAPVAKPKLGILLQHASLANYNRQLINWSIDDEIYREYVLWPNVFVESPKNVQGPKLAAASGGRSRLANSDVPNKNNAESEGRLRSEESMGETPSSSVPGNLNWRRALWEYFYPPVRHEMDPLGAAEIAVKFLRQRVSIVPHGPLTIEEMWRQRKADANGFEALTVAAFRSVGIPARLDENGRAELFADGKWQAVPEHSLPEP